MIFSSPCCFILCSGLIYVPLQGFPERISPPEPARIPLRPASLSIRLAHYAGNQLYPCYLTTVMLRVTLVFPVCNVQKYMPAPSCAISNVVLYLPGS